MVRYGPRFSVSHRHSMGIAPTRHAADRRVRRTGACGARGLRDSRGKHTYWTVF